jgi:hypothetical protein
MRVLRDQRVSDSEDEDGFQKMAEPGRMRTSTGNDGGQISGGPFPPEAEEESGQKAIDPAFLSRVNGRGSRALCRISPSARTLGTGWAFGIYYACYGVHISDLFGSQPLHRFPDAASIDSTSQVSPEELCRYARHRSYSAKCGKGVI